MENLEKVGGSLKRLAQARSLLWQGRVDETLALFEDCQLHQAHCFCQYLQKHRHRIPNYDYLQAQTICSIGSGAIESTVKQIDRRSANFRSTMETGACSKRFGSPLCLPQ
jgi:hypothetical protein